MVANMKEVTEMEVTLPEDSPENGQNNNKAKTGVEPHKLLKALDPLLGEEGGIKSMDEVERITNLMKEADKLVSRCIYINVLRATKENDVLVKFIEFGGWDIMNDWLSAAKEEENTAFLTEILKVYTIMPVTVKLLKQNSCGKIIKKLSKGDDESLKILATTIVDQWMKTISIAKGSDTSQSEKSSKDKKRKKDKESTRHHSKSDSKHEHSHKAHKDSKSSTSNSKTKENGLDTNKDGTKSPSMSPQQTASDSNSSKEETRPRAKTVKTVPTKFRSTGNRSV